MTPQTRLINRSIEDAKRRQEDQGPAQAAEKAPGVAQGERSDEIGAVGRQVQQKGASDIEAQHAIDALKQGDRVIRQCYWCGAEVEGDVTHCSKCGSLGPFKKVTLTVI